MRLEQAARRFELSANEVDVLLLAIAPDIDPRYIRLFAYLQDDVTQKRPTVNLLLNLLTDDVVQKIETRSLFAPTAPLRRHRLLRCSSPDTASDVALLTTWVYPAPNIVEYLLGHDGLDARLLPCTRKHAPADGSPHKRLAPDFAERLLSARTTASRRKPIYTFAGAYGTGREEAARLLASVDRRPLLQVDLAALAQRPVGLKEGLQLVLRDARLFGAALYLTRWDEGWAEDKASRPLLQALVDFPYTIAISGTARRDLLRYSANVRPVYHVKFDQPQYERRLHLWRTTLNGSVADDELALKAVATHFRLSPGEIEEAVATANDRARWCRRPLRTEDLFAASRANANQKLSTLATKIEPHYGWQDIVLPEDTRAQLQELVATVSRQPIVYEEWGFGQRLALGKGLNALFAGESGTGKTMAADIIASELGLDLYKIDLSTVVSKYIGETEKNLSRIFSEASTSNAILFFDEADAIFGKRSEVKDSHDRYANIEISYLLQRMESYDGIVILATNLRANLDEAFTRRLHFLVEFPFPDVRDRERIWRLTVPPKTPLAPDVDFCLLAERFRIPGGNIRNIILAAAFLAAESSTIRMSHFMHAARREYQKLGRLLDEERFLLEPQTPLGR
jgi:AAA+ superfamily predicted ATPase